MQVKDIFVKDGKVTVAAASERGFLYVGQTLMQLRNAEGKYPDVEKLIEKFSIDSDRMLL